VQEQREEKGHKAGNGVKPLSAAEKEAQSDEFKMQGNAAFKAQKLPEAVALYTAALELTPSSHVCARRAHACRRGGAMMHTPRS
jgi:hypothetical protein